MTKAEQFLWCVQTAILSNQIALHRQFETRDIAGQQAFSALDRTMALALIAAATIPEEMTVRDAVRDFCRLHIERWWYSDYEASDWARSLPAI
ncbi:hypothetical protein [Achromobacter denitrificans]|uniref:hypothetical protein n=1 Tax=Achromobacter denitrificans TaxID=32002 RepID=UPI0023E8F0C4|nr:hypothetical protein [Achromobacter denitrificans]MDF3849437.1 hypothetical protein [Achromobacter denitrificans]